MKETKVDKRKQMKKGKSQHLQIRKQDEEEEEKLGGAIISSPLMRMQFLILIV